MSGPGSVPCFVGVAYERPLHVKFHWRPIAFAIPDSTKVEKAHILRAFRFELTRVQSPAIRERVVSMLANVDSELAEQLAEDLGMAMLAPVAAKALHAGLETTPSVLYEAVAVPGGRGSIANQANEGPAAALVRHPYRHAKTILALAEAIALVELMGASITLPAGDLSPPRNAE